MGLFDNLASSIGSALGHSGDQTGEGAKNILGQLLQQGTQGPSGDIVGQLLGGLTGGNTAGGGMASMLETLAASGLAEQVTSWMSNQSNLPVSPQQIHDALGSEQVQELAAKSGLPVGEFLKHLADHLPSAASQAAGTPTG